MFRRLATAAISACKSNQHAHPDQVLSDSAKQPTLTTTVTPSAGRSDHLHLERLDWPGCVSEIEQLCLVVVGIVRCTDEKGARSLNGKQGIGLREILGQNACDSPVVGMGSVPSGLMEWSEIALVAPLDLYYKRRKTDRLCIRKSKSFQECHVVASWRKAVETIRPVAALPHVELSKANSALADMLDGLARALSVANLEEKMNAALEERRKALDSAVWRR